MESKCLPCVVTLCLRLKRFCHTKTQHPWQARPTLEQFLTTVSLFGGEYCICDIFMIDTFLAVIKLLKRDFYLNSHVKRNKLYRKRSDGCLTAQHMFKYSIFFFLGRQRPLMQSQSAVTSFRHLMVLADSFFLQIQSTFQLPQLSFLSGAHPFFSQTLTIRPSVSGIDRWAHLIVNLHRECPLYFHSLVGSDCVKVKNRTFLQRRCCAPDT